MSKTKILKEKIEEFLIKNMVGTLPKEWSYCSWNRDNIECKLPKKRIFMFFQLEKEKDRKKLYLNIYLHSDEESVENSNIGNISNYVFDYRIRIRKINMLSFRNSAKKQAYKKYVSIKKYYANIAENERIEEEDKRIKHAFEALPISYQRKEKLEKIES